MYLEMPQAGQEATSTDKPITKCPKNRSKAGYKCVCLNARRIVNMNRRQRVIVDGEISNWKSVLSGVPQG